MARFLLVVPPFAGHVNPTVSVGMQLMSRGHTVAWTGYESKVRPLLPAQATLLPLEEHFSPDFLDRLLQTGIHLHGLEALKSVFQDRFIPLARAMYPALDAVAEAFQPDVLLSDFETFAGALVAQQRKLPWATSSCTSATVVSHLTIPPQIASWVAGLLSGLQQDLGLSCRFENYFSPRLVLVYSTRELVGSEPPFPAHFQLVGPSISDRPSPAPFPWAALQSDVPRVLVSLGSIYPKIGTRFYQEVFQAFAGERLQVILVARENDLDRLPHEVPENFIVRPHIPQMALLPHVQAVVSHAGHNTVVETLSHGLPMVLAPIRDDQPAVSQQVVNAGAGLRVKFRRVKADELRQAVLRVLSEPHFRSAAERIRSSFQQAGGASRAAWLLEQLVV